MHHELSVAIILRPDLTTGILTNTAAAISIGLGSRLPVLGNQQLVDADGHAIWISSNKPVPILQADQPTLASLLHKARTTEHGTVVPFPAFARKLHAFEDYQVQFPERQLANEALDGLGLGGPPKWVKSLTGALKLLR